MSVPGEGQSYPAAVKPACALAGDTTGPVRAPLLPLDDDATAQFRAVLEHATASSSFSTASIKNKAAGRWLATVR